MASYEMQESNLPNQEGKRILFPRMKLWGQANLEDIVEKICEASSFTSGDVKGIVRALAEQIAYEMASGRSVKIEGIGVFSPALGLRKGAERETGEAGSARRNATNIQIDNVHFKADKELLRRTNSHCTLERSTRKFSKSSAQYTPEERLALAKRHLETHPFLTVTDYCQLTGLLRDTAAKELRRWKMDAASGIVTKGIGTHKVYVLRKTTGDLSAEK